MFDASDSVYMNIIFMLHLSSYSVETGSYCEILKKSKGRRPGKRVVDHPSDGFLYPSFNDRSKDIHELLYYTKKENY